MPLYREQGIVLRTHKLGEADRIVVLMTAGRGKVRAVAKGVRKTKSRFGGRLEPPGHLALQLYEGRQLDTVTEVSSIDHFRPLHEDLDRLGDTLALLEVVEAVASEGHADYRLYRMLLGALRTLADAPSPLVVAGFYWKLLALDGTSPLLDCCARCGAEDTKLVEKPVLVAFDLAVGGALCRSCRSGVPVSPQALAVVRSILGGDLAAALRQPVGPVASEVAELATHAMESHLERRLRVARLLHHPH
ncbi:MAG TPA: DNA repair protein RecO [Acidimicrobiales bacterium]|jgi:DNA repair protein RecO (recombination protein O)|nr:DNA repair protein RecO [Acidimicrobiales bacterium]